MNNVMGRVQSNKRSVDLVPLYEPFTGRVPGRTATRRNAAYAGMERRERVEKRILIVDDDQEMTLLLKLTLSRLTGNYEVETANSGRQALEKMAVQPCDLVITDLWMPGMDGLELIAQIRARYPRTRLILVTACNDAALRANVQQLGLQGYFGKPFSRKELLATAEAALR